MPYSDVSQLPANVKKLSSTQQRQWMHVWNDAYSACLNGDEFSKAADCEGIAFRKANGVVKATEEPVPFDQQVEQPTYQMFMEAAQLFAADLDLTQPQWIPFLPKPGSYKHNLYGQIDVTPDLNQSLVDSVKNRVYQEHIPLDAEHQTKLSGAVAWLQDMRLNEDGSGDALVEFTPRGRSLVASGGFKYMSPEWYPTWSEPSTGEVHKNVVVGGAITTRPFFKDKHLRALVATEAGVEIRSEEFAEMKTCPTCKKEVPEATTTCASCGYKFSEENPPMPDAQKTIQLTETELDSRIQAAIQASEQKYTEQVSDLTTKLTAAETLAATEKEAREGLAEAVTKMRVEARSARFSEMIAGKGGQDDGAAWIGDPEKHLKMLNRLADQFGESDEAVTEYIELQRATAQQASESKLFSEVGVAAKGSSASDDPADKLDAMAKKYSEENKVSFNEAYEAVIQTPEGLALANKAS